MADKEYNEELELIHNYNDLSNFLEKEKGWKNKKKDMINGVISSIFIKDGLAIYILSGCEELIREEIL